MRQLYSVGEILGGQITSHETSHDTVSHECTHLFSFFTQFYFGTELSVKTLIRTTVFDLISEHALISGPPPFFEEKKKSLIFFFF